MRLIKIQRITKAKRFAILLCMGAVLLNGCATVAKFDQYAYKQTIGLKVDALELMDSATNAYAPYEQQVRTLQVDLRKAQEYEHFRPRNAHSDSLYRILLNPNGSLAGHFFLEWKRKGRLSQFFVEEKKKQVSDAFDEIIALEIKKIK